MDTGAIAAAWRAQCVSPDVWFEAENQAGAVPGECDGVFMACESTGWRRAYVKPLHPGTPKGRAAREKVAADLAHALGVSVPPAILIRRHDAGKTFERHANASLVLYKRQQPWWAVQKALARGSRSALGDLARITIRRESARALVFDTWVGQSEHQPGHPHNIILGWDDLETSGFAFLDYEYAFGAIDDCWRGDRALDCPIAAFPGELVDAGSRVEIERTIDAVERFDEQVVREIVDRIPAEFLDATDKQLIIDGLLKRRPLVRNALRDTLTRKQ